MATLYYWTLLQHSVTVVRDYCLQDEDEETTSAVTEIENTGRPIELPAKDLYKVHLQKQISKK